jgi:hypothetical protein
MVRPGDATESLVHMPRCGSLLKWRTDWLNRSLLIRSALGVSWCR